MMGAERYVSNVRWTGLLQQKLGNNFDVIEEGLGGRMTNFDDPRPEMPLRNGATLLPISLEVHAPINTVILLLGTADCKLLMNLQPADIAHGMRHLVTTIQEFKPVNSVKPQHCIIVAPARIQEGTEFSDRVFKGGEQKSVELISLYEQLAQETGSLFFNTDAVASVDPAEGVHLTPNGHAAIADGLYHLISSL